MSASAAGAPPPPVTAAISLVSASGKRMHPRVDLPLIITFPDGQRRQATDWSLAGFSLPEAGFTAPEGSIHRVDLQLALTGCALSIEADAKVTRVSGGFARGFRFIGLPSDKARILDHFLTTGVDGDAAVIGGLPVAHGALPPGRRPGAIRRHAGPAVRLLLLVGALGAGTTFVAARVLTVTTDYAAVAGDLQQLHAPEAGYLVSDRLAVGAHLRAGETIGTVQPVASPQARLATETQIASLQTTLDQQKQALEQSRAGFATFLAASQTELNEATASRTMLDRQVAAEERAYGRLVTLQAKDIVAQQRLDQEQQVLLTLQRAQSAARDAEEAARQKLANAQSGRFSSDGRSTQKSPADLSQEIDATGATIARLGAMLAGLANPLPLLSPCTCTVATLAATPGAFVLSGAALADLAQDGATGTATVDALVQNPRLALVRQGQDVTVYLADRPDPLPGHVTAINYNPGNTGRTGLPAGLRTLDDYGLLSVQVEAASGAIPVGLPASVMAPIGWRAIVASTPALRWGQSVVDAAVSLAGQLWSPTPETAGRTGTGRSGHAA